MKNTKLSRLNWIIPVMCWMVLGTGCQELPSEQPHATLQAWDATKPLASLENGGITTHAPKETLIALLSLGFEEGQSIVKTQIIQDPSTNLYALEGSGTDKMGEVLTTIMDLERKGDELFVPSLREVHSCTSHCEQNCSFARSETGKITGCRCSQNASDGFCNHTVVVDDGD